MWIPITLFAATVQVLRTASQHRVRDRLSVNAAGFVRYAYGAPIAAVLSLVTFGIAGQSLPHVPARFLPIVAGAGLAQIGGTIALLHAFDLRDFAIGTVYAKTEVLLVTLASSILLAESLRPLGWLGVAVCMTGVAWLAGRGDLSSIVRRAGDPAAVMGIAAGGLFALAAVGIRAASTSLGDAPSWQRALLTLTTMLVVQTVVNGTQLAVTEPVALRTVVAEWRRALPVGVLSLSGSAAWALAVTLENAAKVRTLGQVELIIGFAISTWWLHQRHGAREYLASGLVLTGVLGVLALG